MTLKLPSSMPEELVRRRSPHRRIMLIGHHDKREGLHRIVLSRNAIVAWSSVVCWGSLLWAFQVLQQGWEPGPTAVRSGVMEGVRPPVSRKTKTIVWEELYHPPESTKGRRKGGALPRTWPQTYESIPIKRGPKLSKELVTKQTELRHLPTYGKHCFRAAEWHSYSFPTCNNMHELDFLGGVVPPSTHAVERPSDSHEDVEGYDETDAKDEVYIEYKFSGASRSSWLVHSACTDGSDCVAPGLNATDEKSTGPQLILKTLNWDTAYDEVVYEHQRIDALVSERLTSSPRIIDIYGFCGGSAMNEFADGGSFGRMIRRMNETESMPPEELLVHARDAALGLADMHEIDGRGNITTFVHHDYGAKNFLTVNGKLKISDFNDGQLLGWDRKRNRRCRGFFWDGKCGENRERTHRRSPEECMGDRYRYSTSEKVEVYHLGSFLFYLLTEGGWPYMFEVSSKGVRHQPKSPKVKKMIASGVQPALPVEVQASNNTAVRALVQAMKWAYTYSPKKRPSARAVGEFLDKKVKMVENGMDW